MAAPPAVRAADLRGRLVDQTLALVDPQRTSDVVSVASLPGTTVLWQRGRTAFETTLYKPLACLILRGRKEVQFAGESAQVGEGDVLLVSHDLPIVARVREAPYLACIFEVDLGTLRSLYEEVGELPLMARDASAIHVAAASPSLLDAFARHLALMDAPADARALGPLIHREIHYRLLASPSGGMLRNLIRHDSHASAITRALNLLRRDLHAPMSVAALAREVGMSVSSFHKHFRDVTAASPLQYQKELRLLEAQRMLVAGTASVTAAAYEVGYESPTQFSREYARRFGRPPSQDRQAAGGSGRTARV